MGWNALGTTDTYIEQTSIATTLNVVSPGWFKLDADQLVISKVDPRYVTWAHDSGKQVWPLFGNRFDSDLTNTILSDPQKRQQVINTVSDSLIQNNIDGINIDFENIDIKNKADYVDFIRELKNTLQPHGILVSVDVSRENPDPFWSGSFDRRGLGKVADYIVLMGYDEDLGGGGHAGSVASLPWVEKGLQLLLNDVPASKVILGIPFYTRDWVTDLNTSKLHSTELALTDLERIIADKGLVKKWDPASKQNYVEYLEGNEKHQIWVEDENSVKLRLNLVENYNLKGTAAWCIGKETPDIWQVFHLFG